MENYFPYPLEASSASLEAQLLLAPTAFRLVIRIDKSPSFPAVLQTNQQVMHCKMEKIKFQTKHTRRFSCKSHCSNVCKNNETCGIKIFQCKKDGFKITICIPKLDKYQLESFASSLYLGNPMDPPDVLGMEPGVARPTKLPNRAKSTPLLFLSLYRVLKSH